jgi:hypothetical protein
MKTTLAAALMALAASALFPLDGKAVGDPSAAASPARTEDAGKLRSVQTDSRGDGFVDDVVYFNEKGQKVREELDFNRDGRMDDFLYYQDGVLAREEIDSHFDGRIDLRIYLYRGIYVQRYERDTDGDGVPDVVKDFSVKK